MPNETMQQRIEYALDYARKTFGKSNSTIAAECNSSRQSLGAWKSGKGALTVDKLPLFSHATGINIQWLVSGEGPVHIGESVAKAPVLVLNEVPQFKRGREYSSESREYVELLPQFAGSAVNFYALAVPDDALDNEISKGDTVVVDAEAETDIGENGVFLVENTNTVVIRKYLNTGAEEYLVSLNDEPQYRTINITSDNPVLHLGRVEYVIRFFPKA